MGLRKRAKVIRYSSLCPDKDAAKSRDNLTYNECFHVCRCGHGFLESDRVAILLLPYTDSYAVVCQFSLKDVKIAMQTAKMETKQIVSVIRIQIGIMIVSVPVQMKI